MMRVPRPMRAHVGHPRHEQHGHDGGRRSHEVFKRTEVDSCSLSTGVLHAASHSRSATDMRAYRLTATARAEMVEVPPTQPGAVQFVLRVPYAGSIPTDVSLLLGGGR